MNTIKHFLLIACLSTGIPLLAAEPTPGAPTNEAPSAPATTIQTQPISHPRQPRLRRPLPTRPPHRQPALVQT